MNTVKRSGKLLKAAFAILLRERKLLLFPLIAFGLVMVVALFFLAPVVFYPTGHSVFTADHWRALVERAGHWFNFAALHDAHGHPAARMSGGVRVLAGHPVTGAVFALLYFISMFLATFSNVAFYHEIMRALNGDAVSIRRGYEFALTRWRAVLLWSLFAGLVGYLIRTIQERVGLLGRIFTGLVGFAWSVACIFIIPTLVRDTETANPLKLLRNSTGVLKRTWGELVVGFVGLELAFSAVFMILLVVLMFAAGTAGFWFGYQWHLHPLHIFFMSFGAVMLIALPLSWISSVVNPVYRCALYIYATEGVVPEPFDKELLDSAWKVK
jgi:hypothetical protein